MKNIDIRKMKKFRAEIVLISLALAVFAVLIVSKQFKKETPVVESVVEVPMAWGFPIDSVKIDTLRVKPNQNLSEILMYCGINTFGIERLVQNALHIFDVRKIKAGNPYYIIKNDSTATAEALVYEESSVNYVIFELNDSLKVYRGKKDIVTKAKSTSGIIESSLWNAMIKQGNNPMLVVNLSDIFAWTVDFFGIQPGDQYKVYYDELYVDDKMVGIGKIHAAAFIHMGDTISAYYFNEGKQEGYFDDKGQSLRKAFLKAPLSFSRISSKFSNNRFHPVLKIFRPHFGVDYAAPTGTPVYSIGEGVVVKKAYQAAGGGNYLTINHNSVYASQYMHLDKFAAGITSGSRVKQGQLIGYVGRTGLASGPHLDFRIYKNGSPVDPLKIDAPPVEPISEANKAQFAVLRDSLRIQLNGPVIQKPIELVSK
jgi:murein DD-endopeptidase MepM/ murein hydrolase activator NlpD